MVRYFRDYKSLWILIGLYVAVLGTTTLLRHYNFETQAYDLGIFEQSFWNAAHGRGLTNSLEQIPNHLGVHMSPGLFLLVPGYAVFPSPYYLLIIQTLALALGAWPLFLLAKKVLQDHRLSLLITIGYLLYPSLHWLNFYDFHEIAFFVPLLLAALYFIEIEKWGWAGLFLALSASVKEDAVLAVLFVGVYLLLKSPPKVKMGLGIITASLAYFLLTVFVLMPAFGGALLQNLENHPYSQFGQTFGEIIKNIITSPVLVAQTLFTGQKFFYLLWLLLPVAFLPLWGWPGIVLLVPGLAENLLSNHPSQFSGLYQYDAILIPGLWVAVIYGLHSWLKSGRLRDFLIRDLVLSLVLAGFVAFSPMSPVRVPTNLFSPNPSLDAIRGELRLVPPELSVAASPKLLPHLSHRERVYMFGRERADVDFVVIDQRQIFNFGSFEAFAAHLKSYRDSGRYEERKIDERYGMLVKQRL